MDEYKPSIGQFLRNGYPINESGILDQKGMAKHDKGYPINSFGTHPKKRK